MKKQRAGKPSNVPRLYYFFAALIFAHLALSVAAICAFCAALIGLRAFPAVLATGLAVEVDVDVDVLAGWILPPLILAQRALAASEIFLRVAELKVDVFFGTAAALLPPPFFAAQRAFINAESLALPAADRGDFFGPGAEAFCADGTGLLPAFILAQRALARAESLALAAADIPEPEVGLVVVPFDPNREESSASSFVNCSFS